MQILKNNKNTIAQQKELNQAKRPKKIDQLLYLLPFSFGSSKPVVAVIRLEGVIGKIGAIKSGLTLPSLNKRIEKMFKLDKLDAVCLCINSPGGSPVQSELISKRIYNLSKKLNIPVYSFVEDVAASGGYWLACAGSKIFASRSSIIGSIGVISSSFGFHHAMEKLGIERRVFTEGKSKSVLDPFQPVKNSDVKIIKALQKNIHEHFIDTIKERRSGKLTQSDEILFTGEFWNGQTALDFGLIDGIDDLYSFINKRYGDDVKIEYIEDKQSWLRKKLCMSYFFNEFTNNLSESIIRAAEAKIVQSKFDLK